MEVEWADSHNKHIYRAGHRGKVEYITNTLDVCSCEEMLIFI